MAQGNSKKQSNGSGLDFEAQLWATADKMRGHMDASESTPQCVVQMLVAMLEPYKGRVFETLQSANMNCSKRRMKRGFPLSASNGERAWGGGGYGGAIAEIQRPLITTAATVKIDVRNKTRTTTINQ